MIGMSEAYVNADKFAESLNGAENSVARVLDTIPAMVWYARPDGSLECLNRRWRDYTGLSPSETKESGYQAAVHPEDRGLSGSLISSTTTDLGKPRSAFDARTGFIDGFSFAQSRSAMKTVTSSDGAQQARTSKASSKAKRDQKKMSANFVELLTRYPTALSSGTLRVSFFT